MLGAFALLLAAAVVFRRRTWATAVLFFFATALATSPLVGPFNARADRYLVLPSMAGAMLWALGLMELGRRVTNLSARNQAIAFAMLLSVFATIAHDRARVWRDDVTLWASVTEQLPQHVKGWTGLAYAHRRIGQVARARAAIDRAQFTSHSKRAITQKHARASPRSVPLIRKHEALSVRSVALITRAKACMRVLRGGDFF